MKPPGSTGAGVPARAGASAPALAGVDASAPALAGVVASGLALALAAACATAGGLRDEPLDAGAAMVFQAPFDRVYGVAREAVVESGLRIDAHYWADDSVRMLLASRLMTEKEVAAAVRVVVEALGEERTAVRILSRRTVPTEITFGSDPYAEEIFSYMVPRFVETPGPEGEEPP